MFTTMEDLISQTVAFSGYRTHKIKALKSDSTYLFKLKENIMMCIIELYERGYRRFITGCASGFDLIVAKALLDLRKSPLTDIKIIAAIPHVDQEKDYPIKEQAMYLKTIYAADEVRYVSKEYHDRAYLDRNKYMLIHSSVLVCYYDGQRGGTMYTVNRALRMGHEIINLCEGYEIEKPTTQLNLF